MTNPEASSARNARQTEAGPTAVCLDDDPLVGPIFLTAARRAEVPAAFASDLTEFQRLVTQWRPSVVVLDQVMPERTGAEVILWLRTLGYGPKVIVIGADSLYLESAAALVRGGGLKLAAAIRKPLSLGELAETLREAARSP